MGEQTNLADTPTPSWQVGTWTLTAPDGAWSRPFTDRSEEVAAAWKILDAYLNGAALPEDGEAGGVKP